MNTKDFKDILNDRLLYIFDEVPELKLTIKKEYGIKDIIVQFEHNLTLEWENMFQIMEVIDIVKEQTQYVPHVLSLKNGESDSEYYVSKVRVKNGMRMKVRFIHNQNSL